MKETVNESRFLEAFRQVRPNQFSRKALVALFDYLDNLEQELGEEQELDVIAICCDWTEHADPIEAAEHYGWSVPDGEDRDNMPDREALEYLQDQTHVVEFDGGILVLNF